VGAVLTDGVDVDSAVEQQGLLAIAGAKDAEGRDVGSLDPLVQRLIQHLEGGQGLDLLREFDVRLIVHHRGHAIRAEGDQRPVPGAIPSREEARLPPGSDEVGLDLVDEFLVPGNEGLGAARAEGVDGEPAVDQQGLGAVARIEDGDDGDTDLVGRPPQQVIQLLGVLGIGRDHGFEIPAELEEPHVAHLPGHAAGAKGDH